MALWRMARCVYDEKGGLLAASIFAQGELNGTAVTAADEC